MSPRALPVLVLIASVAGMLWFSQRLGVVDTIALLACGLAAGCALAALAARGTKGKRA